MLSPIYGGAVGEGVVAQLESRVLQVEAGLLLDEVGDAPAAQGWGLRAGERFGWPRVRTAARVGRPAMEDSDWQKSMTEGGVVWRKSKIDEFEEDGKISFAIGVGSALLLMVGIPVGFALIDEDTLRMTDDFAAITASVIAALMLVKAVEAHLAMKRVRESFADLRKRMEGPDRTPVDPQDVEDAKADAYQAFLSLFSLALLGIALMLIMLWAAIDGHGPAKWLAWFSWCSVGFALGILILSATYKLIDEFSGAADLHALLAAEEESPDAEEEPSDSNAVPGPDERAVPGAS